MSTPTLVDNAVSLRRSMLFVPAHVRAYVNKAPSTNADAIVLDLEDAVPADLRSTARASLMQAVGVIRAHQTVIVRVNNSVADLELDLRACRDASVGEILLPKVDSPDDVDNFRRLCDSLDYDPLLSILIESSAGLARAHEILARGAIIAVGLGAEDLRAELEIHAPIAATTSPTLLHAHAAIILAALAAGVTPIGLLGSIAQFRDVELLADDCARAWQMGYRGSFCIHPTQVDVLNRTFMPSEKDFVWAKAVVYGAEAAEREGRGAFLVDDMMIDAPLIDRARKILQFQLTTPGA